MFNVTYLLSTHKLLQVSPDFLVPGSSSCLQINSDTQVMLAGARAVRTDSRVLRLEVPVSSISRFRRFNVRFFYPLLGNSLIILKELNPLSVRKIWIKTRSSYVNGTIFS